MCLRNCYADWWVLFVERVCCLLHCAYGWFACDRCADSVVWVCGCDGFALVLILLLELLGG